MGLFTRRKITKATEALHKAHEAGLAFRQMMVMVGLAQEALMQSESEERVAECVDEAGKAIARGNFNDDRPGNRSAAIYFLMAISAAEQTASLWNAENLTAKVAHPYKDDILNASQEVSRLSQ
jgi:hypothetical protein